jgi:hypothetical protein
MKRTYLGLVLLLSLAHFLKAQAPSPTTKLPVPQQPVYIYLYATVADQVNLDITEDRLRRMLPMIEHLRSAYPKDHVSTTILFSGAVSRALDERNARTHIKDLILDYKKRGIIEVGYDGTDEPTYEHRPMYKITDSMDYEQRWLARADADAKFLTEARDPVTGAPMPGSVGGLEEMQRVFGEAYCIRGIDANESILPRPTHPMQPSPAAPGTVREDQIGNPNVKPEVSDWEVVPVLRRYNTRAVLFGLPEVNPFDISGFKSAALGILDLLSPVPNSSAELYWANNILHTAEWSGGVKPVNRTVHGYEGADGLKVFTANLTRAKVQIVHMELGSEKDYLKPDFVKTWFSVTSSSPSLAYAYAHPDNPTLPAEAKLSAEETNAAYAKEDAALKWLAQDFFPANAGSHFVSSSDFEHMTSPATGYSISVTALNAALTDMLAKWGNDTFPPNFLLADGHYLSMAEVFQVMADCLAEFDRTGKLPRSVKVVRVYGPIGLQPGHGPNVGELSVARIAKECTEIAPRLHDETADPMPHNSIPPGFIIDKIGLTSAQFLRMMAQAMVNPVPDAQVRIRMTYMFTAVSELLPRTRTMLDTGAAWTFKPAPLDIGVPVTRASR